MDEGAPPGDDPDLEGPRDLEGPDGLEADEADEARPPQPAAGSAGPGRAKAAVGRVVDWVHEHRNEILGFSALALGVWYPHRHAPAIRVGAALLALWVVVGLAVAATRWSRSIPASWCWRLGFGVGGSALAAIVVHELGAHQGRAVWAVISTVCFVPLVLALVGGHLAGIAAGAVSTGATVALAVGLVLGAEGAVWLGAALQGDVDGTRRVVPEVVVVEPSDPPVVVILDPPATAPTTVPPTAPPPAEPAEPISGPTRLTG